ncbi:hypothetical protein CWR48_15550 [Oceanobacillus arenosus]|uniref:Uncharacterized protein n=1 Tax=Oceanobacillus arenosus TaxID=1229153 RepID=A0A3D8PNC4_9BACI|nr:hypothetical protein [Oceanobacillus arenosus]RDW17017.1 hypothetical protein CWR48_15550 [Oceanobacillus arenosus]
MDKKLYYFTFGAGQPLDGHCQPILAKDLVEARETMFMNYGNKWSFQYTEEEWDKHKAHGFFRGTILLDPIESI